MLGGCGRTIPLSCRKFPLWKIIDSPWKEGITRLRVDKSICVAWLIFLESGLYACSFILAQLFEIYRCSLLVWIRWRLFFYKPYIYVIINGNGQIVMTPSFFFIDVWRHQHRHFVLKMTWGHHCHHHKSLISHHSAIFKGHF